MLNDVFVVVCLPFKIDNLRGRVGDADRDQSARFAAVYHRICCLFVVVRGLGQRSFFDGSSAELVHPFSHVSPELLAEVQDPLGQRIAHYVRIRQNSEYCCVL